MHHRRKLLAKITADKTENMYILTFNNSFPFLSKTVTCQVLSTPWQWKVFSVRCKMDPVRIVKIIWIHMSVLQSLRGTRIISIIIIFYLHVYKTFRITATMEEVFEPLTHSYIGGGWGWGREIRFWIWTRTIFQNPAFHRGGVGDRPVSRVWQNSTRSTHARPFLGPYFLYII